MSLIVVAMAAVSQQATTHQVDKAYQKLFARRFLTQIEYFSNRQQERLQTVADACAEATNSTDLHAAMKKGDVLAAYHAVEKVLLPNFVEEMQKELGLTEVSEYRDRPGAARAPDRRAKLLRRFTETRPLVRLMNSKGKFILPTTESKALAGPSALRPLRDDQIRRLLAGNGGGKVSRQQVGYAAFALPNGEEELREYVVTPIMSSESPPSNLGALILAIGFTNVEEQTMSQLSDHFEIGNLMSGLWLGGKIRSKTIPASAHAELSQRIAAAVKADASAEGEFPFTIDGEPYRAIFSELNPDSPFGVACQISLFSLAEARREQRDLSATIASAAAGGLALALLLILWISRSLTRPIDHLVHATEAIRQGDYQVTVPVQTRDELGKLSQSFNEMAEGLALSRKYFNVLAQVTDKAVAKALLRGEVTLGGEVREVSVLFCDIRGFTSMTEGMPPDEVIALLNEHMTSMTQVVYQHHGVVDKFVGDMVMAVFGAPVSYGHDAFLAAQCALDMLAERQRLNVATGRHISIGIGLATGLAVAGCMGSTDRLNYTVLGERVNLASRLCGASGKMEVVIDAATLEKLDPECHVVELQDLALKGFTERIPAWKLLHVSPSALPLHPTDPAPSASRNA